jgi:hypothetical protein
VQFLGICTTERTPFLIIEYAERGSLYSFLRDVRHHPHSLPHTKRQRHSLANIRIGVHVNVPRSRHPHNHVGTHALTIFLGACASLLFGVACSHRCPCRRTACSSGPSRSLQGWTTCTRAPRGASSTGTSRATISSYAHGHAFNHTHACLGDVRGRCRKDVGREMCMRHRYCMRASCVWGHRPLSPWEGAAGDQGLRAQDY